jgi:hypothetical protein
MQLSPRRATQPAGGGHGRGRGTRLAAGSRASGRRLAASGRQRSRREESVGWQRVELRIADGSREAAPSLLMRGGRRRRLNGGQLQTSWALERMPLAVDARGLRARVKASPGRACNARLGGLESVASLCTRGSRNVRGRLGTRGATEALQQPPGSCTLV